jgi:hypothetical protein
MAAEQGFFEMATPYIVLMIGAVVIPLNAFLVKSTFAVKAALQTHEATDNVVFKDINDKLLDLKSDSNSQNDKLDDIRDLLPRKRVR